MNASWISLGSWWAGGSTGLLLVGKSREYWREFSNVCAGGWWICDRVMGLVTGWPAAGFSCTPAAADATDTGTNSNLSTSALVTAC